MSSYLLDTQVWLWLELEPDRVPAHVRQTLSAAADVAFSAASAWEIAIKYSIRKLPLPAHPTTWVPRQLAANGIRVLPITLEHTLAVTDLPKHHGDPFDRLLIAQAGAERLSLVSADPAMAKYDVDLIRV